MRYAPATIHSMADQLARIETGRAGTSGTRVAQLRDAIQNRVIDNINIPSNVDKILAQQIEVDEITLLEQEINRLLLQQQQRDEAGDVEMEATSEAIDDALQGQINELETEIQDRLNQQDQGNLRGTVIGLNPRARPTFDLPSYEDRQMEKRGTMVGQATRRPTFDLPSYEARQTNLDEAASRLRFMFNPATISVTELKNYVRENQLTPKKIDSMSSNELSNIRKDILTNKPQARISTFNVDLDNL
jgi:flagellar biosynthesis component FlhA